MNETENKEGPKPEAGIGSVQRLRGWFPAPPTRLTPRESPSFLETPPTFKSLVTYYPAFLGVLSY